MTLRELLKNNFFKLPLIQNQNENFKDFITKKLENFQQLLDQLDNDFVDPDKNIDTNFVKETQNQIIENLKNCIEEYYNGNPHKAYEKLNAVLKGESKDISAILNNKRYEINESFYRIRLSESNYPYKKEQMFHIPFELRNKVSTQRFSIPGFPSLYLGRTLYICWEELRRPGIEKIQTIRFKNIKPITLLDLTPPDTDCEDIEELYRFFMTFPLIMCCSVKVKDATDTFKPEYIVPQLLLQWIRNNDVSANKIGAAQGGSIQEAYYYTADFIHQISHPQVRIDSLQMQSDFTYENHVQTYQWIKRVTRQFNGQLTPEAGKSYTLKIKIQNNDGIQVNDLIWARGNLMYDPVSSTYFNQKRAYFIGRQLYQKDFIGLLPFGTDFHDFWAYNSFLPNPIPHNSYSPFPAMDPAGAFNDPCSKLEGGYWRLPTFAEYKSLDDTYGNKWNNNSSNGQAPERDEITYRSYKYFDIPDSQGNVERLIFYKTGDIQHIDGTSGSHIYSNQSELSYMVRDYYNSNSYQSVWSNGNAFTIAQKDYRIRMPVRCVQPAP